MAKKVALLIGVSQYQPGLNPLPAAVKDVEALREVLINPKMGDFADADVQVLKNPQVQEMREAIEKLFSDRHKEDLLLFYFSGHGIKDEKGKLYFATRYTTKNNGRLQKYSAVAASYLHEHINDSRSQRQIIILDCCFSGAIAKGMTVKDDGTVNVKEQLGGEGRAILTSSSSTQYSFEQENSELSIYTRYLVEGINTGAADKDGDGYISIDELHDYANSKVQEASPAMTPKFYPVEQGHKIFLAKSPQDDPKLKYRKKFTEIAQEDEGNISFLNRIYLNQLRNNLSLSADEVSEIEFEVLQPYRQRQEKLQKYEEALSELIEQEYPISEKNRQGLKRLQEAYNLTDEDIASIEQRIFKPKQKEYELQQREAEKSIIQTQPFEFETATLTLTGKTYKIKRSRGKAEFFKEDLANGVFLEMVKIPGGNFLMGSPEDEPKRSDNEGPQHKVTVQPFYMGKFPITQEQYEAIMGKNPSHFKGKNKPVESVTWDNAVEFCARISQKNKQTYRLPSEAEWEYACRAGTTMPFHFGDTITTDLANYNGNLTYGSVPKGQYRQQTTDVGIFPANAFGLYDVHGNVWEWCLDNWHENYQGAPNTGNPWLDNNDNLSRILRGASWNYYQRYSRSAYRTMFLHDNASSLIGFRVVFVLPRT